MCGRVTLTIDKEELMEILGEVYGVEDIRDMPLTPNYNVAPSNQVLSVIDGKNQRRAGLLTWGFVQDWVKEDKISHGLINARSETVDIKPSFKTSFSSKRCVVFADHFYEWKREKVKRPFVFQVTNQPLMPMAAIYNIYTRSDGSKLSTCAILTCEPNEVMSPIHHRMPVILKPETIGQWLNPKCQQNDLKKLLLPYDPEFTSTYEVSSHVNSVRNTDARCLEPLR